jgi:hypothetical protein
MQDRSACIQDTPQNSAGDRASLISCMEARGYSQDPNGDLAAPPDAIVPTAGPNPVRAAAESTNPQLAARRDYARAVAHYQSCLAEIYQSPDACEGQRNIMNADAQVLSAPTVSQKSNVYVGR